MFFKNITLLNPDDILLVTYPGSGTTWLANVLGELGLNYIDGYTENLIDKFSSETFVFDPKAAKQDLNIKSAKSVRPGIKCPRIIKTHLWPAYFESFPVKRAIFLVRDARDAVISYYYWRRSFSEEGEQESLQEFLRRPGFNGITPLEDWTQTVRLWMQAKMLHSYVLLKLEDSKLDPITSIRRVTDFIGVNPPLSEIEAVAESSSFSKMQAVESRARKETTNSNPGMVMRSGKAGQWIREFNSDDYRLISTDTRKLLTELGYP